MDLVGDAPALVFLGSQEQLRELAALLVELTLFRDVPDQREDEARTVRFRHDTDRRHDRVHGVAPGTLVALVELGRRRAPREQPADDGVRLVNVVGEREVVEVPADDLVSWLGEDARERRVRGDIASVGPDDLDTDREIVDEPGEDLMAPLHAPTQEADAGAQHGDHGGRDDPLPGGDGRTAVPEPPGRSQDRAGDRRGVDALGDAGTDAQHGEGCRREPAQESEDVPRPEPVDIGADPRGPDREQADERQLSEIRAKPEQRATNGGGGDPGDEDRHAVTGGEIGQRGEHERGECRRDVEGADVAPRLEGRRIRLRRDGARQPVPLPARRTHRSDPVH